MIDPRVQVELDTLNHATETINRLKLTLEDAKTSFNQVKTDSALKLEASSLELGCPTEDARPYYAAKVHREYFLITTRMYS